jgi:acetylornithine deacetylase/succinyl-diaminopimelate desuccinylase-like protein
MITRTFAVLGLVMSIAQASAAPQSVTTDPIAALSDSREVRAVLDSARSDDAVLVADQIRFCEIEAPPFKEVRRASALKQAFEHLGLSDVRIDRAGNVIGSRPGVALRPHLVVAAHLDTVFPEGTDVHVRRDGSVLTGPGIGDNCRGLATLVAIVRVLNQAGIKTPGSVTFVANVGEEGLGNLRGVRELLDHTIRTPIDRFLTIDGSGLFLANVEVGSHRYRVTFSGPGGHSYARFGTPNPIQAMGRAIARVSQLRVPDHPRTTFSVGRVGGGTAVNAIPTDCWMEVDLRSASATALTTLDADFRKAVDEGVREENARWNNAQSVLARVELIGDRAAGRTPESALIVRTAQSAARALGLTVPLTESSTDASVPVARGIPAIAIGAGGRGMGQHTTGETFDTTDAWRGTQYATLLVVALAR